MRPHVPADLPRTVKADTDDYLDIKSYGGDSDHFTNYGPGIYGFNWWFNATGANHPDCRTWPDAPEETIAAVGFGGNCCVLLPSERAVLVAASAEWGKLEPGKADSRMNRILAMFADAVHAAEPRFTKLALTDRYYCDGINTGDFNRDGKPDVVAGPYWYEGPRFEAAHEFYPAVPLPPEASPSNSMFSFAHDFSGDGWDDILVLGRVHKHAAQWYENPKDPSALWTPHFAFERVRGESPTLVDIDGDGHPQLICHWDGCWGWIEPDWSRPTEPWTFHALSEPGEWKEFYHGTGVGDVNADGRLDLILNHGWFEQPADSSQLWTRHPHQLGERGGAQILVDDVDGDGDNDLISSLDAHGWGVAWFEQVQENGTIAFRKHMIVGSREEESQYGVAFSQPHALALGDIDGDGLQDLVTGKRMWAHGPTGDIEPSAEPVVYWFQLVRDAQGGATFRPHRIDNHSGVGTQLTIADVDQNGTNDVLTVSKLGTFVFLNERR